MILSDVTAPAHYQNVFGILNSSPIWVGLAVGLLTTVIVLVTGRGEDAGARILASFFAGVLMATLALLVMVGILDKSLQPRINANIEQKYGVTLAEGAGLPKSDDALAQPFKYKLKFPNGTKSEYIIRFDRATSEPFITDQSAPLSPKELEQHTQK